MVLNTTCSFPGKGGDRIIVLGDSFIEGFGAAAAETMPAQLQVILSDTMRDRAVQVMNGGISGSDLADEFRSFDSLSRWILSKTA